MADSHKFERRDGRKPRIDPRERPGAKHGNIFGLPVRIAAVITLAQDSAFICQALGVAAPARAWQRVRGPR